MKYLVIDANGLPINHQEVRSALAFAAYKPGRIRMHPRQVDSYAASGVSMYVSLPPIDAATHVTIGGIPVEQSTTMPRDRMELENVDGMLLAQIINLGLPEY